MFQKAENSICYNEILSGIDLHSFYSAQRCWYTSRTERYRNIQIWDGKNQANKNKTKPNKQKSSCFILSAYVWYIPFPNPSSFQSSGLRLGEPVQLESCLVPHMGWVIWSMAAIKENMFTLVSSASVSCRICFLTFTQYCTIPCSSLLSNSYTSVRINIQGLIISGRHLWYRGAAKCCGMKAFLLWLPPSVHRSLQKEDLCIFFPEEE